MRRRILLPALLVSVAAAALTVPPVGSAAAPARVPHPLGAVAAAAASAALDALEERARAGRLKELTAR